MQLNSFLELKLPLVVELLPFGFELFLSLLSFLFGTGCVFKDDFLHFSSGLQDLFLAEFLLGCLSPDLF